nr:enoyl-CoA hydratase/isomerase family protein [Candidatus Sigynarchaeota archaeon]
MADEILVSKDKITRITLNNPEKLNTFTIERLQQLTSIFKDLEADKKVKCVVIDAIGEKAFSAGLDTTMLTSGDVSLRSKILEYGSSLSKTLFYFPKPVISVVCAPAVGWGCIITMLSDFRYVTRNVYFKLPELEIGLYPATGALTLCMMHFGPSRGNEVMLLSKKLGAEEGARIGFVNGIGETREEIATMASETAKVMSRLNQQVAMYSKVNMKLLLGMEYGKALDLEARCFNKLLELGQDKDWHEKYLEDFKRAPQW